MPNGFQQYLLGLPQDQFDALYNQFTQAKPEPFSGAKRKHYGTMGIATPQDQAFAQKAKDVASNVGKTVYENTLEDPVNRVKSWGTLANPYAPDEEKRKARDYVAPLPINPDGTLNEEGLARAGGAIMGISTFHGSPKGGIKKLSNEFVGSGEGAQAYGWGSYTAEGKGTGEWYRDNIRKDPASDIAQALKTHSVDAYNKLDKATRTNTFYGTGDTAIGNLINNIHSTSTHDALGADWKSVYNDIKTMPHTNSLYQVELLPHQDEYLQWDKPLSEQSEKVRKALNHVVAELNSNDSFVKRKIDKGIDVDGSGIYAATSKRLSSDKAASEYLESLGIKGIKYLDGASRGKGEGNYNYVTFNPEAESIITHENDVRIPNAVEEAYAKVRDPESKALLEQKYPELRTTPVSVQQMYNKTTDPARMALLEKKYPELKIEARENGGPMQAGKPYLVGENGPEIVVPKENGYVIPNNNLRPNGTPKGYGYFGKIPMLNDPNKSMTEITIGLDELGDIPLVVPTLTAEEIDYLRRGNKPTKEMVNKAADHAIMRRKQGLSPYYD